MPSIDDLQNPASLPDASRKVSVAHTHISVVFVADDFAYKIKKPVNFGFLDFSTLEKRRYYCHQEVELNRRLSKDIYIDVLPIYSDGRRFTMKDRRGEVVEYAVKMKRLPDGRLMKSMFERSLLTEVHLKQVAEILAGFHLNALRTHEIDGFGEAESFRVNTDENFDQVEGYLGLTISQKDYTALKAWTKNFYKANTGLFARRINAGRIRDCHGDLHMEHICLTEEISVIDCIEFNDRFRYSDTLADIAFLLMDLEYHGGNKFSRILWDEYKGRAGEDHVDSLLTFYKVYRAFVRGKVNSFQVHDGAIGAEMKEEAVQRAKRYFQLARSYIG
jgi:aminoglycoside phosphotransferase family enzyme